jgi:hypothetical protein
VGFVARWNSTTRTASIPISEFDIHLHNEGTLYEAYRPRAHRTTCEGVLGWFAVWALNENVSLAGDFNEWTRAGT